MITYGSDTYFLELSTNVSLKVATNGSVRSKKIEKFSIINASFIKQKQRSVTKKIEVSSIKLAL